MNQDDAMTDFRPIKVTIIPRDGKALLTATDAHGKERKAYAPWEDRYKWAMAMLEFGEAKRRMTESMGPKRDVGGVRQYKYEGATE